MGSVFVAMHAIESLSLWMTRVGTWPSTIHYYSTKRNKIKVQSDIIIIYNGHNNIYVLQRRPQAAMLAYNRTIYYTNIAWNNLNILNISL